MLRTTSKFALRANSAPLRVRFQKRFYGERSTQHTTEKTHSLDVQSDASKRGMKERQESHNAETQGKKKDPKKEYPEAPGPIIGMQDERGHKDNNKS